MIVNKFIDNHSENQSDINYPQKSNYKFNINSSPLQKSSNLSNINNDVNYTDFKNLKTFNINLNTNGKKFLINFLKIEKTEFSKQKVSLTKRSNKKNLNIKDNENFAIPPSKKLNQKNHNNFNLNISLNLTENNEDINKRGLSEFVKKSNKNNSLVSNKNSLILPLNETQKISFGIQNSEDHQKSEDEKDENYNKLYPELQNLKEEYDTLKNEYNHVKSFLELKNSEDKSKLKEKEKLKKKIKKRLKQIKDIFKEKIQLN